MRQGGAHFRVAPLDQNRAAQVLTALVVLIGAKIALLGLLAIVRERFWPVALIVLILLGFGVMQAEGSGPTASCGSTTC